ncbi:hypothetical protein E1200_21745 [Actinomadura sp. GC306]|uniref:hypothetical protein n=1 Tax=Actinomadura sp. GC306 TaxID=2530367 RepID=UPI0010538F35|nr:hypothetical protein [Actinomadura sp. GC306]TDC63695.1 hypothetical protein E1200_21745 [Actinomadura sp. GC306]
MRYEIFADRRIQVIDIDDVGGEHVLEFVDPNVDPDGAVLAVYSVSNDWSRARVSISPKVEDVSVEFMSWALQIAQRTFSAPGTDGA